MQRYVYAMIAVMLAQAWFAGALAAGPRVTLTVVDSLSMIGSASATIVASSSGPAGAHSSIYLPMMRRS